MNTETLPSYVTDAFLRGLKFRSGKGTGKEGDRCSIQEYRAWRGLDPASDEVPKTDSSVVGRYIIGFQDRLINAGATPEQVYEHVGRHLPKLHLSGRGATLEARRSFLLTDMLVRELAPMWLELTPELVTFAEQLRAHPAIVDCATNEKAYVLYDAARSAAWNVRSQHLATFRTKLKDTLLQAKPEGLRADYWAVEAAAAVEAAVEAAAVEAAVEAVAVEAAEAVAAVAAVAAEAAEAAVAVAAANPPKPGEDPYDYYWRVLYPGLRNAVFNTTKTQLLAKHRERIERSWALGGRFIEQALAMTEAA